MGSSDDETERDPEYLIAERDHIARVLRRRERELAAARKEAVGGGAYRWLWHEAMERVEALRVALAAYRSALRSGERETGELRALGDAALQLGLATAERDLDDAERDLDDRDVEQTRLEAELALALDQLDAVDASLGPWEDEPGGVGVVGRVQTILNLKADRERLAEARRERDVPDAVRAELEVATGKWLMAHDANDVIEGRLALARERGDALADDVEQAALLEYDPKRTVAENDALQRAGARVRKSLAAWRELWQ